MIDALIALFVVVLVVGIVLYIVTLLIKKIPMDSDFKQILLVVAVLIAVLIVIGRALPLLGIGPIF